MCQPWLTLKPDKEARELFDSMGYIDDTSLWKSRTFISSCFLNLWLEFPDSLFKSGTKKWYKEGMPQGADKLTNSALRLLENNLSTMQTSSVSLT